MKERRYDNQRGASLIIAIALLLVMGIISAAFVSMVNTETFISMNQSGGQQTFFIAEGGVEFGQRSLAQNLDWYRSAVDPILIPATNLGAGSFSANINLPATMLRSQVPSGTLGTIRVYTTDRFPANGNLQIEDDITGGGEFVTYNGTGPTTFTITARGVSIGGISNGTSPHSRGDVVYPVTTLSVALVNSCTAPASFTIATHPKFLGAGTVDIEGEEISYTGSTTAGGTTTLTGVTRCQNGTASAAHNLGRPVTPMLVDTTSPDFEAEVISTGTVGLPITGNAARVVRKTVQR
ncbi:MAG: hypothetical protein EPO39_05840 [Candidatus Manganitrophaceae bacterium]|nr:MAG: hypothetical protein EPO39_05840 [Candidatus Manganitrophaceae bacterium]